MPAEIHRTAMFTLPTPTRHARAALERAFREYTHAYETLLEVAWRRYGATDDIPAGRVTGLEALRGAATYALDERTSAPRLNARTLTKRIFTGEQLPPQAVEALTRLPSRLRQSAREHAGQTLLSYVALTDAWLALEPAQRALQRGGAPRFPHRRRAGEAEAQRQETLDALATLADDRRHERALVTTLLTTKEPLPPAIPFVGISDDYGCGLYYQAETDTFYARLDILTPTSRYTRPLAMRGVYTSLKTGERWASAAEIARRQEAGESVEGLRSFGRRSGIVWLPIKLDEPSGQQTISYHQRPLRFTRAAYLPQPAANATAGAQAGAAPALAEPVSAKLVRRQTSGGQAGTKVWYQLHVAFALPKEALDAAAMPDGLRPEQRPILGINRGLLNLYAAVLLTADGREETATFAASGAELLARQAALEKARVRRQQQGKERRHNSARDRRQSRIASHEINVCANQIVEVARRARAQVVLEDLSGFASGAAMRDTRVPAPRARAAALRTFLGRRQFEALHTAIDQRLALVGLPPARVISAAYISQTCTRCGARETRSYAERQAAAQQSGETFDPRTFICPRCGNRRDVDTLAAVNVGRKFVWLRQRRDEKAAGVAEDTRTGWDEWLRDLLAGATQE